MAMSTSFDRLQIGHQFGCASFLRGSGAPLRGGGGMKRRRKSSSPGRVVFLNGTAASPELLSPGLDLVQEMGVPVEHHEEFHQRERRPGFAVLVARKRIRAAAKDCGRLPLVERQLLADTQDEGGINN